MFDTASLKGMVNTLTVEASGLSRAAAVAAMVRTATAARDRVLGGTPAPSGYRQIVDTVEGAPLAAVRADGTIIFAWQYLGEVVARVYDWMVRYAPRESGKYQRGIMVFADGAEVPPDAVPADARQVWIVATVAYARRLEVGKRKSGGPFVLQVPYHNVEALAVQASRLLGGLARISFTYFDLDNPYVHRLKTSSHRRNPGGGFAATPRKRNGAIEDYVRYPAVLIEPRQA